MTRYFWSKRRVANEVELYEHQSSVEVIQLKRKSDKTAKQAHRDIKKLNQLLKADGITLKIHIATGGGHRGR